MGYAAPSAEDVYRYALRLDRHDRSLTDRFGLTILFVNDTSPICWEFLQRYCVDLCLRTADRIRFVFFSDLPRETLDHVAKRMNRSGRSQHEGMVQSILDIIASGVRGLFNRFDHEYDPWRTLRPEPFSPLSTYRDIERHLDWQSDLKTAMPGIGEALNFAHKLGIGRHVPCFLVFSDIGEHHLHVLPIADMTPDEAYSHVRTWIDQFYANNRDTIVHWKQVEQSIENICQQAQRSLREIRDWPLQRSKTYEQLRIISRTILLLEKQDARTCISVASELPQDHSVPYEVRGILAKLRDDLIDDPTK